MLDSSLIVKKVVPFTRNDLTTYLEEKKIGTRNIFSGNLLRHPAYKHVKYRKIGEMKNADIVANQAFWLGVFPGIDKDMMNYVLHILSTFLKAYKGKR